MKENLKKLLDDLKAEQSSQQGAIQKAIKSELSKTQISYENLDSNLKSLIMAKSSSSGSATIPTNPMEGASKETTDSKIVIDELFKKVVDDLTVKNNVYLYGKAGTGKTVLAKNVAKYLNKGEKDKYYILNCSQWTSPMQIIGGFSIKGYEAGQLELAWRYGGVLILDELPKLDPNTAGLLNDALSMTADKGELLTNGKGEKIPKHEDFMVVGAGNTDMKTVSVNFAGNNRQDYSLVDRFSGSMYVVGVNEALEQSHTYTAVWNICDGLRKKLTDDSVEAITFRSMLNFNRIYQMEMLRKNQSPLAFYPVGTTEEEKETGKFRGGKGLKDCVDSFIDSLGTSRATTMRATAEFKSIEGDNVINLDQILKQALEQTNSVFYAEFTKLTGYNAKTGKKA